MKKSTVFAVLSFLVSLVAPSFGAPVAEASTTNRGSSAHPSAVSHPNFQSSGPHIQMPQNTTKACPAVPIVYPLANTTWVGSTQHNVTWDTTRLSGAERKDLSQYKNAKLYLNHDGKPTEDASKAFDGADHPLAEGFSLAHNQVEITIPKIVNGEAFQILMFLDPVNSHCKPSASDIFKIRDIFIPPLPSD